MSEFPKIAFVGAGSTVFMKNIVGDVLHREALKGAHIALMDINETRLKESEVVAQRMVAALGVPAKITTHLSQREALDGADFVVTAFQVGGYDPCTITDFDVPKEFGLRQTIADTIGVGGILRGVRTVPHLWSVCEDMMAVCPDATLLQYVNPMAINIWAITRKFPKIKVVGLCHSVQHTAATLAADLGLNSKDLHYRCAGINHIAFFLHLQKIDANGTYTDLYPALQEGYANGTFPTSAAQENPRCKNIVRYEILKQFGHFVTESSEHFSEYVPWFIKEGRTDLIERFEIPLDEYPTRCIENIEEWQAQSKELMESPEIEIKQTEEYASEIMNSIWTGTPSVIYGNVANTGLITNLPQNCAVEVPCLVDRNGVQPTYVGDIPPQLAGIMQTNVTPQGLTVEALINEDPEFITHAAMMDPHTAAELDLDQIRAMVLRLREVHGEWLPAWARV